MIPRPQARANAAVPKGALSLRLYVAGNLPHSVTAVANLRKLCLEPCARNAVVDVVDVLRQPERALAEGVVATPMLVRLFPLPVVKIIGALTDMERVRAALGLTPLETGP